MVETANRTTELAWGYNPWRANLRRPLLALLLEVVVAAMAGWSSTYPHWWPQALGWGGVSLLLLLGMTATIFLPVRYKLDLQGVTVYFLGAPSFRKWEHYRNFYVHKTGVHLTTLPQPSGLDPFRGHFLQYGAADGPGTAEQVAQYVEEHLRPYLGKPAA
jgi:hypothetical protein